MAQAECSEKTPEERWHLKAELEGSIGPALGRLRQKDPVFEAWLSYTVSPVSVTPLHPQLIHTEQARRLGAEELRPVEALG